MQTRESIRTVRRGDTVHRLDEMTAEELSDLEFMLMDDITAIKDSLAQAAATLHQTGVYADPDWYRRATAAKSIKARQLETVKRARKAAGREAQPLASFFMDAARDLLSEATFLAVMESAQRRREAVRP